MTSHLISPRPLRHRVTLDRHGIRSVQSVVAAGGTTRRYEQEASLQSCEQ